MDDLGGRHQSLHETATRQHGAVTTSQLLDAGFSEGAIARMAALEQVHRGVYAYGAVRGSWFDERAAMLACGARAVLSHTTSLALYDIRDRPPIVHVTRPSASAQHRGVLIHRATLEPHEIRTVHGVPVTSPLRTLQDLAPSMPAVELERLIEEMQIRGLVRHVEVAPNRPGAPRLREVVAGSHEPSLTRSEAERRMLELIRAAHLPQPVTNVRVGRFEVDMLWREQGLVVEIDGFPFHGTRAAFERDRARDAELQALGYRVIRITWRRLVDEPHAVVATIAGALSAARPA
jgi:very-short-patch-repair endonuclease